MSCGEEESDQLLLELASVEAIKFGNFTLKSGLQSPVYFDLRVIVSYPNLMEKISKLLWKIRDPAYKTDVLCGVPYTALPLATVISVDTGVPMLIRRKEAKGYGTKKILEGNFRPGDRCLIVEDVVTSGSSVLETADILRSHGLVVDQAVVLLNREQGGEEKLRKNGITLHSLAPISQLMELLFRRDRVDAGTREKVLEFVRNNQVVQDVAEPKQLVEQMTLEDRRERADNTLTKKLLDIMIRKKSNLCVAVDVLKTGDLLQVMEQVGPYVCCVKTHVDIISDWSQDVIPKLISLAEKFGFLLFEDRKFADIGNTVKMQYSGGLHAIASWADLVTTHGIPGPGVLSGLQSGLDEQGKFEGKERGALILAEMSSAGNLISQDYSKECVAMAEKKDSNFAVGLISQSRLSQDLNLIQFTPGVNLSMAGDQLGQRYVTVEKAVCEKGADVIIVGRGITGSEDVQQAARKYQEAGWNAISKRCQ